MEASSGSSVKKSSWNRWTWALASAERLSFRVEELARKAFQVHRPFAVAY